MIPRLSGLWHNHFSPISLDEYNYLVFLHFSFHSHNLLSQTLMTAWQYWSHILDIPMFVNTWYMIYLIKRPPRHERVNDITLEPSKSLQLYPYPLLQGIKQKLISCHLYAWYYFISLIVIDWYVQLALLVENNSRYIRQPPRRFCGAFFICRAPQNLRGAA